MDSEPRVLFEKLPDGRVQITAPMECPKGHPWPVALRFREHPEHGWKWECAYCKAARRDSPERETRRAQRRKLEQLGRESVRKRNGLA